MKCRNIPRITSASILVITLAFSFLGCSGASKMRPMSSTPGKVTLDSGDQLEIRFFKTPELNETQTVRPDGKLNLQLIGEVTVRGLTPEEFQDSLVSQYSTHLKNPGISVAIRSFYSRRVYVGGEVRAPGFVEMPGQMTLLEAVLSVGGYNLQNANPGEVMVIRQKSGVQERFKVDISKALKGKDFQVFYLEPYDIVYVPQSGITKVNQWVDQHINRIIPQFGLMYTKPVGDGSLGIGSYRY
ncbi:MAG: polysaccharide biosynthesis/export family protein [Candidatus Latescibacterota bacterium]